MTWTKTLLAAAGLLIGFWMLVFSPRLELAQTQLDHAKDKLAAAAAESEQQKQIIQAQAGQLATTLVAELKNRELLAQIASQNREQTAALQELKRNDETIFEYLRQPVPAALGQLYQRTETADPSRYRAEQMPADTLPASSSTSTDAK